MSGVYKKHLVLPLHVFLTVVFSLCAVRLSAENILYEFGAKTGRLLVFAASASADNQSTTATVQLEEFARKLSRTAPEFHIIVAITKNDISELPDDIPVKRYGGVKTLIQTLNTYTNAAICIIESGSKERIKITAGTSAGTAPSWFLQSVYHTLKPQGIPVDFYSNSLIFHRLGWLPDDPVLRLFNEAKIPALKIETNADLSQFFSSLPAIMQQNMSNEWDTHYLTQKIAKKLLIITEKHIIGILIFSSMVILFWLMVFSFLFGKKREQHIKDLLLLWWMPLYFFLINWIGFFLGTKIAEFLFYFRFSSSTDITFYPLTALIIKYFFALFFMLIFTAFNRLIPLPANRFIYGFMGHTVCLLNIFIFSFVNLSFSVFFLVVYVISFAAYHVKNIVLQIIFIICLFVPLMPFAGHILLYRRYMFDIILFTNIEPALIFIPFDLFFIRLVLSIEKKRKRTASFRILKIPIHCALSGGSFLLSVLWVLLMPTQPTDTELDFILTQRITGTHSTLVKKYRGFSQEEEAVERYFRDSAGQTAETSDGFLMIKTSVANYFERSIGSITVDSPIRAEAISITVHAKNGVAVFEADAAFEQNPSGDTAVFTSSPRPALPLVIHFSGKKNPDLTVTVMLWSKENPFNIRLREQPDAHRQGDFLLEVRDTVHIKTKEDKTQ